MYFNFNNIGELRKMTKSNQFYIHVTSEQLEDELRRLWLSGNWVVSVVKHKLNGKSRYLIVYEWRADESDDESVDTIDTSKPLDYSDPTSLGACFGNDTIEVKDGNANILVRVGCKHVVLNVDILEHVTDYGTLYLVVKYLDQNLLLYLNGSEGVFKFGYYDEVCTRLKTLGVMDGDKAHEYVKNTLPKEEDE